MKPKTFILFTALIAVVLCLAIGAAGMLIQAVPSSTGTNPPRTDVEPANQWYRLYFTTPRYPDKVEDHHGGIDERLVAFIDLAKTRLDVAIYDFDLDNVAQAIVRAKKRGVTVRFVTDSDTIVNDDKAIQAALSALKKEGISIVGDNRGPFMHNKFVVRDDDAVWTGSWNFTTGDTYRLNNNAIEIRSMELADNYRAEFDKMFVKKLFGPKKTPGVPYPKLTVESVPIENYFAAEDDVAEKIVNRIRMARKSIYFLAFQFTSDSIGKAIRDRASNGVKVAGIFEKTGSETQFSEFGNMKRAGLEVYQDGSPYVMHHKVIILDEKTVIFGSYNFSDNADTANDENVLIVDDTGLAGRFLEEFNKMRDLARNPIQSAR